VTPEDGAPRESVSWVLGLGLGLAVIAACAAALLLVRARPLDPAEALRGSFEVGALPFGMRLDAALELPGGETVVVLADERELELDAGDVVDAGAAPEEDAEPSTEQEKPDWAALEELEPGGPPARLFLVRYPEAAAEAALDRGFRSLEWRDLAELGAEGGRVAVEGGRLDWGPFAADYVRERRFLHGPAFQDSVRVNLARPGQYWIAYAFWPRDHAGSWEPLEELLAALRPAPLEE
jgi:hypothetical protein